MKMDHIDEITLELSVLNAGDVAERRTEIALHIRECNDCAALEREIEGYYAEVRTLASVSEGALDVAKGWMRPKLADSSQPMVTARPLTPRRVFRFATTHPVYSSAISLGLILGIVLLLVRVTHGDDSLMHVKAAGDYLVVENSKGAELWRKQIGAGFEARTKDSKYFSAMDIDGNGVNEVIVMSPKGASFSDLTSATVLCLDPKANERWRFQFKPGMTFGGETFSADYDFEAPLTTWDTEKGGQHKLFVASHHRIWWPSAIICLNAADGRLEGLYWHPGWIRIDHGDIDLDGTQEIIAAGYNNAFKKSCLVILDPQRIQGHAPATSNFSPRGVPEAVEKYYILLPNPDIYELANHWTEGSFATLNSDRQIEMRLGRILPGSRPGEWIGTVVIFYFDSHMNCIGVKAGDDFTSIHVEWEKSGRVKNRLDRHYFDQLRRGVLYWDGERFVSNPSMNKGYLEPAKN